LALEKNDPNTPNETAEDSPVRKSALKHSQAKDGEAAPTTMEK